MAKGKGIVWTKFLEEEAIYRFWYVLENNNFKKAIKDAQKEGRMSYSIAHNALYAGLYYPDKKYTYGDKVLRDIKEERELKKRDTLANFMSREEILENIHAMYECACMIRDHTPFGYNAVMFTREFYRIGQREKQLSSKKNIEPKLLHFAFPQEDETTPNKPNRYRLAKKFVKLQKNGLVYSFKTQYPQCLQEIFEQNLLKFKTNYQKLNDALVLNGITDLKKRQRLINSIDCGFYRTILPHYGFSIKDLAEKDCASDLITVGELNAHAKKFEDATNVILENKNLPLVELAEKLKQSGEKSRDNYISIHRTYPETKKGFLNAFCEMIAKAYEYDTTLLENGLGRSTSNIIKKIIETLQLLDNEYKIAESPREKEDIEKQVYKIQSALESSNTHNI